MRTIVISDIHLGVDDRIAECVQNRSLLISFLEHLRKEKQVDEVVINGDFLDQWFYPGDYEITEDSNTFYLDVAANNAPVIDAFKALLADGIKVVYFFFFFFFFFFFLFCNISGCVPRMGGGDPITQRILAICPWCSPHGRG